ncbi:hypothetical protein J3S85_19175 [Streptomyces lavenduligriseus]|nr:hypothetical protein J3S85_19175 [Streptomyces lavenduligriseus]
MATILLELAFPMASGQGISDSFAAGRTGLALDALAHYRSTGIEKWLDTAVELAGRIGQEAHDTRRTGFLHGRTGPALLNLHLHRVTGDDSFLSRATGELRRDLKGLDTLKRIRPGLDGTGGIATVARAAVACALRN